MSEVRKLTKLTPEEEAAVDRSTLKMLVDVPEAEVEGQEKYLGIIECAWCGHRYRAILDTDYEVGPSRNCRGCSNCGRVCRA